MKKRLSVILISILMLAILIGCGNKKENEVKAKVEQGKIKVKALKGPPAVSMVKLFADNETGKTLNKYETSIINSVDEVVATVAKKDYDIITIPSNLASVMYNKTNGDVKIASILALGINYIVGNNDTVKSIQDLKGKTIYTFGKGATPEIVLNYVLKGNGLEPGKDVKIEFKSEATEVAAVLASEKDAIAMLPEPFLSSAQVKNPKLKVLISMGDEWDKVKGTLPKSQISGVVIVRKEFAEKNPEAVKNFLKEYQESIQFLSANPDEAAKLTGKYGIVPEPVAKRAIPRANITFIAGNEMKEKMKEYLKILYKANPKSVGGKLPKDDFYIIN